ncbi:hypothetical protein [Cryptosporangium aurantiacum]|uniref:Uncharacterized protein n=1 Tax=Cryptosporangium aurantiacum TaxID=134849 RepID=A0A1M7RMH7_9ACTN|nr:hypothetical protein [Cryptosporangium aurantiacum]SHN47454.1 hypothetical protein SAMN05443668_12410 [Cryptosporangium aurantiacum]
MSTIIDAEALFVSALQPSDLPTPEQVRAAIAGALLTCGGADGCAVRLAAEFGEHPETAVARMQWAIQTLAA